MVTLVEPWKARRLVTAWFLARAPSLLQAWVEGVQGVGMVNTIYSVHWFSCPYGSQIKIILKDFQKLESINHDLCSLFHVIFHVTLQNWLVKTGD